MRRLTAVLCPSLSLAMRAEAEDLPFAYFMEPKCPLDKDFLAMTLTILRNIWCFWFPMAAGLVSHPHLPKDRPFLPDRMFGTRQRHGRLIDVAAQGRSNLRR